jgi:hypothetical protein
MTLPAIYITLYLLIVILCFTKRKLLHKYKKVLITAHLIVLLLLLVDIFLINLKGVWLDRLIAVTFLLTGSATFAFYRKTLQLWQKIYFGIFIFYPAIAATTFLIDRIMFIVVASPLLISLTIPETRFSNKEYEVREQVGLIAPQRLQLIKKGFITEKVIGTCSDESVAYLNISSINVVVQTQDTTKVIITSKNKTIETMFTK